MFKNIVFRIISVLVLVAAIAGIASFAFNAGVARGVALNLQIPATGAQMMPFYGYGMPGLLPFPFSHPGFGAVLIPLFLVFLAFGAARRALWGPSWGWHHPMHHRGTWGDKGPGNPDFVPPMISEWHRRMHQEETVKKAE